MEYGDQSPVKLDSISSTRVDQSGSQLIKQPPSGSDAAAFLSVASFTPNENIVEPPSNPRPSRRVIPPDETGIHQVTFTVTISVAIPPGMSALCM